MKPTELKMLRKLVKAGGDRPLSEADMVLRLRIHYALQEWERSEIERAAVRFASLKLAPCCGEE